MGDKYLSEVITAKDIMDCENNRICIFSGVGSGKNTFIEEKLVEEGNILYISSRRAKVNEILENKLIHEHIEWERDIGDVVSTTNAGIEKLVKNERFGKGFRKIIGHFDFMVVDEAHSIASDATFANSSFHLLKFLEYVNEKYPRVKIILMTGTPEPLENLPNFLKGYKIFDKREECLNVCPKGIRFVEMEEAISIMASLPDGQKTIYYTNSARSIVKGKYALVEQLKTKGVEEAEICICMGEKSIKRNKAEFHDLKKVCEKTKEAIAQTRRLPKGARYLFTTSTLKEGINIEDASIQVAFCETHLLSDIIQFAGRVRKGLDILYIIHGGEQQHDVDDKKFNEYIMEAIYSAREACDASNNFLLNEIKREESALYCFTEYDSGHLVLEDIMRDEYSFAIYGGDAIRPFISLIENRHQYLKFNHLQGEFAFFMPRFREQYRVHQAISKGGWVQDLEVYSKKYKIDYIAPVFKEENDFGSFCEYLKEKVGVFLVDEEKKELKRLFVTTFELKSPNPQTGTLNKCLENHKLLFEISDGMTSRDGQNKRYLCIKEL